MHQCTHCQADLATNAQFCTSCGASLEENPTYSTDPDEVDTHKELEDTSKMSAVAMPVAAALPTLRTRRMHPKSPIPAFPPNPWSPLESPDEEDQTPVAEAQDEASTVMQLPLTPPIETTFDSQQAQEASEEQEMLAQTMIVQPEGIGQLAPNAIDISSFPLNIPDEAAASPGDDLRLVTPPTTPDDISASPTGDLIDAPSLPATTLDDVSASPTGDLRHSTPPATHDDVSASPTGDLIDASSLPATEPEEMPASPTDALVPSPADTTPDDASTSPGKNVASTPFFPPPTPEKRSTPRPGSLDSLKTRSPLSARRGGWAGSTRALIAAIIIILVVLGAGAGVFALVRQNASTGTPAQCNAQGASCTNGSPVSTRGNVTRLTFSGAVAGPMTIVGQPRCQNATSGNLHTLAVNLSGTINGQLYNFGFVIEHYNGPGTYSNATASIAILFDTPGQSTTNGWGNNLPTDSGSITIERGAQTGKISYTLSGVGTQAKTQIQTIGNWTCTNS